MKAKRILVGLLGLVGEHSPRSLLCSIKHGKSLMVAKKMMKLERFRLVIFLVSLDATVYI